MSLYIMPRVFHKAKQYGFQIICIYLSFLVNFSIASYAATLVLLLSGWKMMAKPVTY